jgi:peroxiredoxin
LRVGDTAPAATVLDVDGHPVDLNSLWPHGPVLVVFLRHFGCIFCRELLAELQARTEVLAQAGLVVVAVGLGEPRHAQRIGGRYAPDLKVLAAPAADAYAAFGIVRAGLKQILSPLTFAAGARAALGGSIQANPTGDQQMVGGAFVVDRQGVVRFAHYDTFPGDKPDLDRIVALGRRLTRRAA